VPFSILRTHRHTGEAEKAVAALSDENFMGGPRRSAFLDIDYQPAISFISKREKTEKLKGGRSHVSL
jgi:hypothetical protein